MSLLLFTHYGNRYFHARSNSAVKTVPMFKFQVEHPQIFSFPGQLKHSRDAHFFFFIGAGPRIDLAFFEELFLVFTLDADFMTALVFTFALPVPLFFATAAAAPFFAFMDVFLLPPLTFFLDAAPKPGAARIGGGLSSARLHGGT